MASMMPYLFSQFLDDNGDPLALGKLTFYATGTTDPLDTYSDASGETAHLNPLTLDSAGRSGPVFFGTQAYDIILQDADDNIIDTYTAVTASGSGGGSGTAGLTVVNTLNDLRALASGAADYLLLAGGDAVGDGESYFYYWDADSAAVDNGVTVVQPDSAPANGRWLILRLNNDLQGTFTVTLDGVTTVVTGTAYYVKRGNMVTVTLPALSGTSNIDAAGLSGFPAAILPTAFGPSTQIIPIPEVSDAGAISDGALLMYSGSGGISVLRRSAFNAAYSATFTASGTKKVGITDKYTITYLCHGYA